MTYHTNNMKFSFLLLLTLIGYGFALSISNAAIGDEREIAFNLDWAQRVFSDDPGAIPPKLNRLIIVHEDAQGDTKIGLSAGGRPLRLGGKTYHRGIGVNSHSVL